MYPSMRSSGLAIPPFFADLKIDGKAKPELRIDGYIGQKLALSRSFSSDRTLDRLHLHAADSQLVADGSDATWLIFGGVDKFDALRPFVDGDVTLTIEGPGQIVGDNPFRLEDNGGSAAVLVQTISRRTGRIRLTAKHPQLGTAAITIYARRPRSN